MATITVGGFYLARVTITRPIRRKSTAHVEVVRELDRGRWEVVDTHSPQDRYIVTAKQLEPESDAMRVSREESWRRWGRTKVKK